MDKRSHKSVLQKRLPFGSGVWFVAVRDRIVSLGGVGPKFSGVQCSSVVVIFVWGFRDLRGRQNVEVSEASDNTST